MFGGWAGKLQRLLMCPRGGGGTRVTGLARVRGTDPLSLVVTRPDRARLTSSSSTTKVYATLTMDKIPLNYEASEGDTHKQVTSELPSEVVQCLENARFVRILLRPRRAEMLGS